MVEAAHYRGEGGKLEICSLPFASEMVEAAHHRGEGGKPEICSLPFARGGLGWGKTKTKTLIYKLNKQQKWQKHF
jgi:hypothetical protein